LGIDGAHISQYNPDRTAALLSEAGRLIRGAGFSGINLTFIGGLVPSLLIPELDPGIEPHIGSADIDLCLSIALATGRVGAYQRLEKALADLGYRMKPQGPASASSWQWVGGAKHKVTVEFFCAPVAENKPGTLYRPEGDVTKGLSAMTLGTGALIDRDLVELSVKVRLPDGTDASLPFRVTAPAAYLASKADALLRRDKNKDAYDIVWLCEAWPGGQSILAKVIRGSSVFDDPLMKQALGVLTREFDGIDSLGSRAYAKFVEPQANVDLDSSSRRASGAVRTLLSSLTGA
jgi:hypothetical protein